MMRKEIKLTILKIIKFVFILLIADLCFGFVANKAFLSQKTGKFSRNSYAINEAKENIIIFGSSLAHRHYVPEVLEEKLSSTCYNAGADGQHLPFHYALQKMILKRTLPKLIILNIDKDLLFKSNIANKRLSVLHPYYSNYKKELNPILSLNDEFIDFKMFFKTYQNNSTLIHAIKYYLIPQSSIKGYRPQFTKMTPKLLNTYKKKVIKSVYTNEIDENLIQILKDFIGLAKSKNIKLVFVTSPNLITTDVSKNESFIKIKSIAEFENIPYFNFLNSPDYLNKLDLFYDPSHLNDEGSRMFTESVAGLIDSVN